MPSEPNPEDLMLLDKIKSISKKYADLQEKIEELTEFKTDLEARVRLLETVDIDRIKQDLYKIDSKVASFESDYDERKEKVKMVLNFVVQLVWVSMAAWLLSKLGLQPPL